MNHSRSFWVTGASNGLGLALVQRLLEQGHRVAASGRASAQLDELAAQYRSELLLLDGHLHKKDQAARAAQQLCDVWPALDGLIINAGTTDYLADGVANDAVFETIVTDNQLAAEHCLAGALPLLAKGRMPQVMMIFNRYSALQLHSPTRVAAGWNNLPQWSREQREALKERGIDLTVVAPQSLKAPLTTAKAVPQSWTAQSAASELLSRLALREPELILETMDTASLWPMAR
ncbi:SDR family oxidoreductase [Pseudomonas sp. SMSB3]|uniref:SDR family oxidoreductase n=1 Tax=Pseudomonas sp. SMSB3 TaxID=3390196 RepID=UPI003F833470